MYFGHKHHNDGDLLYVAILGIIATAFILPAIGVYWLFAGKNDIQKIVGFIVIIICVFGVICGGV